MALEEGYFGYNIQSKSGGNPSMGIYGTSKYPRSKYTFEDIFDASYTGSLDWDNVYISYYDEFTIPVISYPASITYTLKKVELEAPLKVGLNREGIWDGVYYTYNGKNFSILRVDEPATGEWIQIKVVIGVYNPGDVTSFAYVRVTSSNSAYNFSDSTYYAEGLLTIEVYETGIVKAACGIFNVPSTPLFTPGNKLVPSFKYTSDDSSLIESWWIGYYGKVYSSSPIFRFIDPQTNNITCTGLVSGPCIGEASAPVADIEYIWAGRGCNQWDGLRYIDAAQPGRNGFLFDDYAAFNYLIQTERNFDTAYETCLVDGDGFIQSTCYEPSSGLYSTYKLTQMANPLVSVFNTGYLEGSDLDFTFDTDTTEVDLSEGGTTALSGPKNVINYGVTGAVNNYYNLVLATKWSSGSDPIHYWIPEAGFDWAADTNGVHIDESTAYAVGVENIIADRSDPPALWTPPVTMDYPMYGLSLVRITSEYFVMFHYDSSYNIELALYKFNTSTEDIDYVTAYTIGQRSSPLIYAVSRAQIFFVPSHGSNGRLYVGDPEYSGSKSYQGRVMVFDWTGSALSYNTDITSAIRNGYEGSCISYDITYDRILVGAEDDILAYSGSTYSAGVTLSPSKGSLAGRHFSAGEEGFVLVWDIAAKYGRLYQWTGSSYSSRSTYGWTYACNFCIDNHPVFSSTSEVYLPAVHVIMQATPPGFYSYYLVKAAGSYVINNSSNYWRDFNDLTGNIWYAGLTSFSFYYPGAVLYAAISPSVTSYYSYLHTLVFDDGSTEQYPVMFYMSSDRTHIHYDICHVIADSAAHTAIGNYYIKFSIDVSGTEDIITADQTFDIPDASCDITFCFEINTDTDYYVPTGVGSFSQYSNFEDARDNACSIDLLDDYMPSLDITSVSTITFYIFLKKELDLYNRLSTPEISQILLTVDIPPLAEPIICLHFGENETVKEVFKSISDILTINTSSPPLAEGIQMVVTGTYMRPLF